MNAAPRPLPASFQALVDYIAGRYRSAVEIGIGPFPDVALALSARGLQVRATDICPPEAYGIPVAWDDVTSPTLSLYRGVELLYALRPPGELIPALRLLADRLDTDLIVKPLADEAPLEPPVRWGKGIFYLRPRAGEEGPCHEKRPSKKGYLPDRRRYGRDDHPHRQGLSVAIQP